MMKNADRGNQGFSLIELMVALTISLLIAAALTQIYVSARQTNRIQDIQSRLTEDGRFSLSMIRRIVSQAGFRPSPNTVLGSGRLTANSTTQVTVNYAGDGTNIINCDGSVVANGTSVSPSINFDSTTKKLTCTSGATVTDWINATGSEMIDFQVLYGLDNELHPSTLDTTNYGCGATQDCVADSYVSPPITSPNSADQVVAVQVCLVLRSDKTDSSIAKAANAKNCAGSDINNTSSDHKLYRTFRSTVLIRNR